MSGRNVVVLANEDATRQALQSLAAAGIDVTLTNPPPAVALPTPPHQAVNGRRYRLVDVTLTDREIQVLQLMSEGNTNLEIGARLRLARATVSSHAKRLYRKLGVDDRASAVIVGLRAGLIEAPS